MWALVIKINGYMKEQTLHRTFNELLENMPKHFGDAFFRLAEYSNQSGVLEICINGFYDEIIRFPFTIKNVKSFYEWLESKLTDIGNSEQEFCLGRQKGSNDIYVIGIKPLNEYSGEYHDCYWSAEQSVPLKECCIFYAYNLTKDEIGWCSFHRMEDLVRRIYTTLRNSQGLKCKSEKIEEYYNNAKEIHLEYKGFSTTTTINSRDLRYRGKIFSPDNILLNGWGFAADNVPELKTHFESMVEKIIERDNWRKHDNEWKNSGVDVVSIGCVFDILPDIFRERVACNKYDKSLNDKVCGGHYEVPLYYVTKAWDIILKGDLGANEFRVEYDSEWDDEPVDRTLEEAIVQNDEVKRIWKELLNIDIDALDVDFSQFDMHLPPKATESDMYDYFVDVPDGIEEWILNGINNPSGEVNFDNVSSLMEFAAYILLEREDADC